MTRAPLRRLLLVGLSTALAAGCSPAGSTRQLDLLEGQLGASIADKHAPVVAVVVDQSRTSVSYSLDGRIQPYTLWPTPAQGDVTDAAVVALAVDTFPVASFASLTRDFVTGCSASTYSVEVRAVSAAAFTTSSTCGTQRGPARLNDTGLVALAGDWTPETLASLWSELAVLGTPILQITALPDTVEVVLAEEPATSPNHACSITWHRNRADPWVSASTCQPSRPSQQQVLDLDRLTPATVAGALQSAMTEAGLVEQRGVTVTLANWGTPRLTVSRGTAQASVDLRQ